MSEENLLDKELLTGYLDNLGSDLVRQMLELYVAQSETYLNEIHAALQADSQELWQERCHKMKGAAGSAGFVQVHAKLVVIEKSGEGQAAKKQHLDDLQALNQQTIAAFNAWLD